MACSRRGRPSCSNGRRQGCLIRLCHPMSTGPTISLLADLLASCCYPTVSQRIVAGGSGDALESVKPRISHHLLAAHRGVQAGAVVTWSVLTSTRLMIRAGE